MNEEDELVAGPRVLGLGLGLFLLVLLWSATLAAVLVCSRLSLASTVALVSATLAVTAVAVAVPRHPPRYHKDSMEKDQQEVDDEDFRVYDKIILWKLMVCFTMLVSVIFGLVIFCQHAAEGVYPQPIRKTAVAR